MSPSSSASSAAVSQAHHHSVSPSSSSSSATISQHIMAPHPKRFARGKSKVYEHHRRLNKQANLSKNRKSQQLLSYIHISAQTYPPFTVGACGFLSPPHTLVSDLKYHSRRPRGRKSYHHSPPSAPLSQTLPSPSNPFLPCPFPTPHKRFP